MSKKTMKKTVVDFGKFQRAGEGGSPVRVKNQGISLPSCGLNPVRAQRMICMGRAVGTDGNPPLPDNV